MTGGKLVGLVTIGDITSWVADGKLTAQTYLFEPPRFGVQRCNGGLCVAGSEGNAGGP